MLMEAVSELKINKGIKKPEADIISAYA